MIHSAHYICKLYGSAWTELSTLALSAWMDVQFLSHRAMGYLFAYL